MSNIHHLGVVIREKSSNRITKEVYLAAKPEYMSGWSERSLIAQIPKANLNYDLNMRYFQSLNGDKFNRHLLAQCRKHRMKECVDLNELDGVSGVYIMVLDEYKQVYIGQSNNIKKRIVKEHWARTKSLERLIFGDVCTSIISIDSFGALDTTRVFYRKSGDVFSLEQKIVRSFDCRYLLNRVDGGIGSPDTYTDDALTTLFAISSSRAKRNLMDFVTLEELRARLSEEEVDYLIHRHPELLQK